MLTDLEAGHYRAFGYVLLARLEELGIERVRET